MAASYASQGQTGMESLLCGCTLCTIVAVLASRTDGCDRRRSEGEDRAESVGRLYERAGRVGLEFFALAVMSKEGLECPWSVEGAAEVDGPWW